MKPYPRKQYWNRRTMSWWERAYIFEITRGLLITGRIFTRNMWRWMTGRKGALTTYYPEQTRPDYAERNLIDRFSTVPGVSQVSILGARRQAMRIWIDRQALAARALTSASVPC